MASEKKIIIAFGCGLGNQMFEYAFYKSMQRRFPEYTFYIDRKIMIPQEHNGYELDKVFGIELKDCSKSDYIGYLRYLYIRGRKMLPFNALMYAIRSVFKNNTFYRQDNNTEYYEEVFESKDKNRYFYKGIWANERYFVDDREAVISDFAFIQPLDERNQRLANDIESCQSVSIHIRRGDYVTGSFNILGDDYYKKAIDYIENKLEGDIHYYVFSDDTVAAENLMKNLTNNKMTIVSGNDGENSWKDMKLMSLCSHNIIANSSFSFWGAYLNENPHKMVVSSAVPMNKTLVPFSCEGWILL